MILKDRLFTLLFGCAILGTFTFGFTLGTKLQGIETFKITQVNRTVKVDNANMTIVAKNP